MLFHLTQGDTLAATTTTIPAGPEPFFHVRRIAVQNLFGEFTYDLKLDPDRPADPRLFILYGDNGSGKTTLLRMLFHLIHPAAHSGHRSFLASCSFSEFAVELGEGIKISAERGGSELVGGYTMSIRKAGVTLAQLTWIAAEGGAIKESAEGDAAEADFFKHLAGLNIGLHMLADNRRVEPGESLKDLEELPPDYLRFLQHEIMSAGPATKMTRVVQRLQRASDEAALEIAVRRASNWVTQQVVRGSSKGDEDANAIYTDIVQRIAASRSRSSSPVVTSDREKLVTELELLAHRAAAFSRYGLIGATDIDALVRAVIGAKPSVVPTIYEVVRPYIDGLEVRLNALQRVYERINAFVNLINGFYGNKQINFHLTNGLSIAMRSGGVLAPRSLSSGERQLLLLFCNLLVAGHQNTIFIIDEPELSLDIKWQRQLLRALLEFTGQGRIQFVLATHSIELLTHHKNNVVRLADARMLQPA